MKQVLFLLILTYSSIQIKVEAQCLRAVTLENFRVSNQNLILQNNQIEKHLAGESVEGFSPSLVFGQDFQIEKTDEKIAQLKIIIEKNSGVMIENLSLLNCLSSLKLEKELKEYIENSTRLQLSKIEFLTKNKDLGDSVRTAKLAENALPDLKKEIARESDDAQSLKAELESALIKKENLATKEVDNNKKELLHYEGELTKLKIELLNQKIESIKNLGNKISRFEESTTRFAVLSNNLNLTDLNVIRERFEEVEKIWLEFSKENIYDIFSSEGRLELPTIPEPLIQSNFKEDISALNKQREGLEKLRKEILVQYSEKKNEELKLLNQLISSGNSLRTIYFSKLGQGYFITKLLSFDGLNLIKNEVLSSPYRVLSFFYSKFLFIREKISLGKEGYVALFGIFSKFLFSLLLFFILKTLFSRFNKTVDSLLNNFLYKKRDSLWIKRIFSIWNRIKENSSIFLWLATLHLVQAYSLSPELNFIFLGIEVYLFSKLLKSVVTIFLGSVSRLDTGNFSSFKKKAAETSDKFRNIFLFYFFTMLFVEATVGRVYIYTFTNYLVFFYSVFNFIREASRWEVEFTKYAEKKFSGVLVEKYFGFLKFCPKTLKAFFILGFILVFMLFDVIISYTEGFEISKKISANLFKKQIENIEAEEGADDKIPQSYKDEFSYSSLEDFNEYVQTTQDLESKITLEVNEWIKETAEEHSVVVYGDKGIGKTTLLKKVQSELESTKEVDVKYVKFPPKTTSSEGMQRFIDSIFSDETSSGSFDIFVHDRKLERKTVIIIDEAQNMFLSQVGGFEAYSTFINIVNLGTQNIFWIMSFNKYSWLYLNRAFGRIQYFRNVFEITGWSDSKIKELIMKRHGKTDFRLSYDLLISATRSQDELDRYASIESKFFKLLWELSRGNPRAALHLWVSALSRKSRNTFNVHIPREVDLEGIEKLPDDLMFIIAEILKHENLLSREIESTTNLPTGIVRNAIKLGLERKFFYKDKQSRYMIDVSTQYGLIRYLRVKNFIYGN